MRVFGLFLAIGLAGFTSYLFWGGSRLYESLGSNTFSRTLLLLVDKSLLDLTLDIANAATASGAAFVAVACCTTIIDLPRPTANGADTESWGKNLQYRFLLLQRNVSAGAVILVAGVVDAAQYLALPTPLLDTSAQSAYKAITEGLLTMQGGEYTLILLSVFVGPVIVIYIFVNWTVKTERLQIPSISNFLAEHGIGLSLPKFLPQLVTIAAPLIAAPVTALLNLASG